MESGFPQVSPAAKRRVIWDKTNKKGGRTKCAAALLCLYSLRVIPACRLRRWNAQNLTGVNLVRMAEHRLVGFENFGIA